MSCRAAMTGLTAAIVTGLPAPVTAGKPVENSFFLGDSCPAPDINPKESATLPGVDHPSPPRKRDAATIKAFLGALRAGKLTKAKSLGSEVFAGPAAAACSSGLRQLVEHCREQPPYLLENGSIRIQWLCNGLASYDSFFVVANGRIRDLDGIDVTQPLVVLPGTGGSGTAR